MEEARDRFFSKVNKTESCWLWTGGIVCGYGHFWLQNKDTGAHRLSWLLAGHTVPEGHLIRHKCRNRHCVNPEHLETGTYKENMADKIRDGTDNRGEKSGHAKLTEVQVREIRGRYTENQRKLAKEYGISQRTIFGIIHRRIWKHLE